MSRHIIATKAGYYRLLLKVVQDHSREPWVLFMFKALEETLRWTTGKIVAIRQLAEHSTEHIRLSLPKI